MKLRLKDSTSEENAAAIANALASHFEDKVQLFIGEDDEPAATATPERRLDGRRYELPPDEDLGPTEREEKLLEEIAEIHKGGPEKYVEGLPEEGKLFVRDRLDLWFDAPDCEFYFEDGTFAAFDDWHPDGQDPDLDDRLPADGLITGAAKFEGRDVHFMSNDYTVKRGSMDAKGVEKFLRMQQRAMKTKQPILYLMDSAGGRIDQHTGFFANREGIGKYYYNHSLLSGLVPQICVLYAPSIAGAAYTPVFNDFTVMVEDISAMAIASPRMVEMATGQKISMQDLGGPEVHAKHSGSADLVAKDEEHARDLVAKLIGYLPDNCEEQPPRTEGKAPRLSPEGIDGAVPSNPNKAYDMYTVIDRIVDAGSVLELQSEYGKEMITAFARIDGRPVGVVANQPDHRAGAIYPDAAEKAAQFVWKCDAFNIPLLYLCDNPGYMAGPAVEKDAVLDKGKKMIFATSSATVPKQSVIVRKAYGAGVYGMSGPAFDSESVIGLPSAEIAIMGPEAAINAVYANKLAAIEDEEERAKREQELREEFRKDIDIHRAASEVIIDEIVAPSRLRHELEQRFSFYESLEKERPDKKHGTIL